MKMNARLSSYLRSLGLAADATIERAWEFFQGLRGLQASIASSLNYAEEDEAARTNCDLMIRALGYDPADPAKQLPKEATPPAPTGERKPGFDGASADGSLERARAEGAEQERSRRASIEQAAQMAGASDELTRTLLADGKITAEAAREKLWADYQARTRANVTPDMPGPAIHSRSSVSGINQEILEAAMLHRSGIDPTKRWVRCEGTTPMQRRATAIELERAADLSYHLRSCSMEDMVRMAAAIDKINVNNVGRGDLMRAYALGARSQFSTAALVGIFTTTMGSRLLAAYDATEDTTKTWTRESDVPNFKPNERTELGKGLALKKLARGGEAEHTTYADATETFKIARYARQFVVDDQDIIDDTFGALNAFTPEELAEAAAQMRPDLVYSIVIANPLLGDGTALFAAARGNLTGGAALDGTTLAAARKRQRLFQQDGRNLGLRVKYAIVPPSLEDPLDVLIHSRQLITGENVTKPENNPNYNKGVVPVVDERLENGVIDPTDPTGATVHAGSASTWFTGIDGVRKTIEVAYLLGTGRTPQLRSFILTEGRWGIGWDINLDIGAAATGGWRGMQKMQAAAL